MREAVIVSTARAPIGKAYRGAFNNTDGADMGGHVVKHAVERAGIDPAEVDDDLVRDVTEVLTSLCARLYGRRSASRRADRAVAVLRQWSE